MTVTLQITPKEAEAIATALMHVRKEVFDREGPEAELFERIALQLRKALEAQ